LLLSQQQQIDQLKLQLETLFKLKPIK
jgi:hypothetical protein